MRSQSLGADRRGRFVPSEVQVRDAWVSFAEPISSDLASEPVFERSGQALPEVLRSVQGAEDCPQASFEDVQAAAVPLA